MTMEHSKRRLSNVRLTKGYYLRYMGLWIVVTLALIAVANLLIYLLTEEHWSTLYALDTQFSDVYSMQRRMMVSMLGIEMFALSAAIVVLAKFTAHRIAGPYIKLRHVFDSVRQGNLDQELHFRKSDHLEEVEKAFNDMMVEVRARVKGSPPGECGG